MSLKKNFLFLLCLSIVLLFLQYLPFLYHVRQTPPDRVYLGAERYTPDYYVYLYYINQGLMDRNSVLNFYTNQKHPESLVHVEYLILGRLGNILNLSLPQIFYLSRSFFLLVFLFLSFWFTGKFLKNPLEQKLVLIFSFLYAGIFLPQFNTNGFELKSYFDFYQPPDIFSRLTFEPHKFMGMSLMLVFLWQFTNSNFVKTNKKYLILIIAVLAGFLHGVTGISIIFTVIFYLLFKVIINFLRTKSILRFLILKDTLLPVLIIFFTSLPLLYWQYVFSKNPVWYAVSLWERHFAVVDQKSDILPTIAGFFFVLAPLVVLALIGLKNFLRVNKNSAVVLLSFLFSNLFLFFLGYIFLGTTKHRYHQEPYFLIWSIPASYGISVVSAKIKSFFKFKSFYFLPIVFYFLLILSGLPNSMQGFGRQAFQFGSPPNLDILGYPPKTLYQALLWLKNNTGQNDVILSLPTAGQIIPAIPGRKVVIGDYVHTYRYFEKLPVVEKFYRGQLTPEETQSFLQKENIRYVLFGWEEKALGNAVQSYPMLKKVYENKEVFVFKTDL